MRILKLIMLMLLLSHWNGCIQFLIPVIQDYPPDSWITINHLDVQYTQWALSYCIYASLSLYVIACHIYHS